MQSNDIEGVEQWIEQWPRIEEATFALSSPLSRHICLT